MNKTILANRVLRPASVLAMAILLTLALGTVAAAMQEPEEGGRRRGGDRERRSWDPVEYLKRLDRDSNGVLDSSEMGERGGRFISQLGFDSSTSLSLDAVLRKIEASREEEQRQAERERMEANRKVPGFGETVELPVVPGFEVETESLPPVPGFGETDGESAESAGESDGRFDAEVTQTVERIMERLDEDKDGFLGGEELRRTGRWIGEVTEADKDRDGRLSPDELGEAWRRRLQQMRSERGENGGDANDREGRDGRDGDNRRRFSGRRDEGSSPGGTAPAPAGAPQTRSLDSRISAYVDNVFGKYDTNSDNVLDADERKEIKVPFSDTNGDGNISRDEAMNYVRGSQAPDTSHSEPARTTNRRERAGRSSGDNDSSGDDDPASDDPAGEVRRDIVWGGRTTITPPERGDKEEESGGSSRFSRLDSSGDGQLQLSEFADGERLTEEIETAFREADKNGDGVITPAEFDG